ncbi:MAG: hypothetical protein N2Z65_07770 [Clostridiales bacterium]|nr:hypothetical protein [Clostridiales bacterium]
MGKKKIFAVLISVILAATTFLTFALSHSNNIRDQFYKKASYNPVKGELRFTIPKTVPEGCTFYLHVSGRILIGDGTGASIHMFEKESQDGSWVQGETYTYPVKAKNLDELLLVYGLIDINKKEYLYTLRITPDGEKQIIG